MMTLCKILLLSFAISAWAASFEVDTNASSEAIDAFDSASSDEITANDQKISITKSSEPIVQILDPYNRGIDVISQIADKSYEKLRRKAPLINYRRSPSVEENDKPSPTDNEQSMVSGPIFLPQQTPIVENYPSNSLNNATNNIDLNLKQNLTVVSPKATAQGHLDAQIDPLPVAPPFWTVPNPPSSSSSQPSNQPSFWDTLGSLFNYKQYSNQNKYNGNRLARQTTRNYQVVFIPQVVQAFSPETNYQDNVVKGTTMNSLSNDKSSESDENQNGSKLTTSGMNELPTTTAMPTDFEFTSTFEPTTEFYTTKNDEEDMIPSSTQSELLDEDAEIDEAVAYKLDGGNISSARDNTTPFPGVNKHSLYELYGKPASTKKNNS